MENLKPCPFCGGKAFIENGYVGIERVVFVKCDECKVRMPNVYVRASYCANDKAAEAWNRRANDEQADKA